MSAPRRVKAYFTLAERGLRSAKVLLDAEQFEDTAVFVHQVVERTARALLTVSGVPFGTSHNLGQMAEALPVDHPFRERIRSFDELSTAMTAYRYPTASGYLKTPPDIAYLAKRIEEAEQLLRDAQQIFDFGLTATPRWSKRHGELVLPSSGLAAAFGDCRRCDRRGTRLVSSPVRLFPVTAGKQAAATSGRDGQPANFWCGIGRDRDAMLAPEGDDGPDGLLRIGQLLRLGVSLGDHLRKRRNQHRKTTLLLRLENDGKAIGLGHGTAPSFGGYEIRPMLVADALELQAPVPGT